MVEAWKGDARLGDRLDVPELMPLPAAVPIARYPQKWEIVIRGGVSEQIPRQPVGSRMILFLKNTTDDSGTSGTTVFNTWEPAELMHDMKASVVWIEGEHLWCFQQPSNPGPSLLLQCPDSIEKFHARVDEITAVQREMNIVLSIGEGRSRAEQLKPYVHSEVFPAQMTALRELRKCGPMAVPVIQEMLDDPLFANEASDLVQALVDAGGDSVAGYLHARLRRELAFWKSTGPLLSPGWWNSDTSPHPPLQGRYSLTLQLIVALEKLRYSTARKTVMELGDFWRSLPQLNDPSGLNQMAEECDKLLAQLRVRSSE